MNSDSPPPSGPSLGDRAAALVRAAVSEPDVVDLTGLERLRRSLPRAGRQRSWRMALGLGATAAVAIGVLVFALSGWERWRPVRFAVDGAAFRADGAVGTSGSGRAALRFSDGTRLDLGPSTKAKVIDRSRHGARVVLSGGRLSASVVARPGARWVVEAGPYEVLVTGTRFDVSWPGPEGPLELEMAEGSVLVRGGLAGAGVHLRAGQRLRSADRRGLLITERTGGDGATHASTAPVVAEAPEPAAPAAHAAHAPQLKPSRPLSVPAAAPKPSSTQEPPAAPALAPLALAPEDRADAFPPDATPARSPAPEPCQKPALFGFEDSTEKFKPDAFGALAFSNARVDRARARCGHGSLRVDADFNLRGHPMAWGRLPHQNGEVRVRLGTNTTDLTGRTLTASFYVDAPDDVRFAAMMFAVSRAVWVGVGYTESCRPRQWCTVSHTFAPTEPLWPSGTATVREVTHLAFQVLAVGPRLDWKGTVNIDDIHLD